MRFNKQEMLTLATQPSQKFDKEGVLFLRERQDGLFRRSERECYYFLVYYIRNTIDLLGVREVSFSFFFIYCGHKMDCSKDHVSVTIFLFNV